MNPQEQYELYKSWIDACMNERHKLSDWERKFIIDIRIQLMNKGSLSEKQAAKLESIYADKTS